MKLNKLFLNILNKKTVFKMNHLNQIINMIYK